LGVSKKVGEARSLSATLSLNASLRGYRFNPPCDIAARRYWVGTMSTSLVPTAIRGRWVAARNSAGPRKLPIRPVRSRSMTPGRRPPEHRRQYNTALQGGGAAAPNCPSFAPGSFRNLNLGLFLARGRRDGPSDRVGGRYSPDLKPLMLNAEAECGIKLK